MSYLMMFSNSVHGSPLSTLLEEERSNPTRQRVLEKLGSTNADFILLEDGEQGWYYKIKHLTRLVDLLKSNKSNPDDISETLGGLANFYLYTEQEELADKVYKQRAKLDLESILGGPSNALSVLNELILNHYLNNDFIEEVQRHTSEPKKFIKSQKFEELVNTLSEAYKNFSKRIFEKRKQYNKEPLLLEDKVPTSTLKERIKELEVN